MNNSRHSASKVPLQDVAFFQEGPGLRTHQWTADGMKVINVTNIIGDGSIDVTNTDKYIALDEFETRYAHFAVEEGDIVVASSGNTYGKVGRIRTEHLPLMMNTSVIRFHCGDKTRLDAGFLYSWLRSPEFINQMEGFVTGGAQPNFGPTHLKQMSITLPEIHLQKSIADILSAYDDLIENNRRRMALLEDAARQLYREWFVRLRFPGHEHTPVTDGVPEGWERKTVGQLTSFLNRGIAPHYDDDAEGLVINQKCIRGGRLDLSLARHQSREFKPERQLQLGDVLVNSTGEGTLGRVAQVLAPIENCTVDTHVTIARPLPEIDTHYFGQALMEWEPRFSTMGRGATNQTELSRSQIGDVEILLPTRSLMQQFEEVAAPSFRQVWVLMQQNENLRAARDLLLPRLMSGEISV